MKLTKKQRLQCYKAALEDIVNQEEGRFGEGVCLALIDPLKELGILTVAPLEYFPEFAALEPKEHDGYWYKTNAERIEVLNNIINDLTNGKQSNKI